jgi:hypothetical protein
MAKHESVETPAAPSTEAGVLLSLLKDVRDIAQAGRDSRKLQVHEVAHDTPLCADTRGMKFKKWAQFYQNGARVNIYTLGLEDVALVDQLKPGLYNHKKWAVEKTQDGGVTLNYDNKTAAQRADVIRDAGTLTKMLQMIVTEQEFQASRKRQNLSPYPEDDE